MSDHTNAYGNNNVYLHQNDSYHTRLEGNNRESHDELRLADRTYETIPPLTSEPSNEEDKLATQSGQTGQTTTAIPVAQQQLPQEQRTEEPEESSHGREEPSIKMHDTDLPQDENDAHTMEARASDEVEVDRDKEDKAEPYEVPVPKATVSKHT